MELPFVHVFYESIINLVNVLFLSGQYLYTYVVL